MPTLPMRPMGQLLRRPPRYGINAAAVPLGPQLPTYLRITDIDESGRFAPNPKVGVDHAGATNYRLAPGELVFARTGASVGKSYLYDPADGELIYAGFLINVAPDPALLNPKYLSLIAQTKEYWDWIARTSVRSGQPGVNGREYATLPVPVPDIAVQDAIAGVMTDVDNLIAKLERLCSKKEEIKQGMMQQLLTGRTRLPGFDRPWSESSIGELAWIVSGGTPKSSVSNYWDGGVAWCTPTDITRQKGRFLRTTERTISQEGLEHSAAQLLPVGSLLLCTRATIGEVKIATQPIATNQGFKSLVPRTRVSGEYLYYKILTLKDDLAAKGTGSTFLEVSKRDVAALTFEMPDHDEQIAIASVLSDADDELIFLQKRLEKVKAIKQGMMQELLTGRTRLPVETSS